MEKLIFLKVISMAQLVYACTDRMEYLVLINMSIIYKQRISDSIPQVLHGVQP